LERGAGRGQWAVNQEILANPRQVRVNRGMIPTWMERKAVNSDKEEKEEGQFWPF